MYTTATSNPPLPSRWLTWEDPAARAKEAPPPRPAPNLVAGLRLVGLPSRQARLYLALSRGPQTARQAGEIAGFHRATAYRVLVRLLERGLAKGDGQVPQRFEAIAQEELFTRLEAFLREEAEFSALVKLAFGRWARAVPEPPTGQGEPRPPRMLTREKGTPDPALTILRGSRQGLDLVARPIACSPPQRTGLIRTLGGALRRGVIVRLLLDATPTDQHFLAALLREAGESRQRLAVRHLAPLGAHYCLGDERWAIRWPSFGMCGPSAGFALVDEDPGRLRALQQRFEDLWSAASAPLGPERSTRSYAWRRVPNPLRPGPITSALPPGVMAAEARPRLAVSTMVSSR